MDLTEILLDKKTEIVINKLKSNFTCSSKHKAVQRLSEGATTSKTTTPFEEPAAKVAKDSPVMERTTAGSLGINQSLDEMIATGSGENGATRGSNGDGDSDGDLDLEGISDSEIDTMILKPAEIERYVFKMFFSKIKINKAKHKCGSNARTTLSGKSARSRRPRRNVPIRRRLSRSSGGENDVKIQLKNTSKLFS